MSLPSITTMKDTKEKKLIKKKIRVGSVVKVGEVEYNTREETTRWMRKEVVGFVKAVVGKKKFVVQFEGGQKR